MSYDTFTLDDFHRLRGERRTAMIDWLHEHVGTVYECPVVTVRLREGEIDVEHYIVKTVGPPIDIVVDDEKHEAPTTWTTFKSHRPPPVWK